MCVALRLGGLLTAPVRGRVAGFGGRWRLRPPDRTLVCTGVGANVGPRRRRRVLTRDWCGAGAAFRYAECAHDDLYMTAAHGIARGRDVLPVRTLAHQRHRVGAPAPLAARQHVRLVTRATVQTAVAVPASVAGDSSIR